MLFFYYLHGICIHKKLIDLYKFNKINKRKMQPGENQSGIRQQNYKNPLED